MQDLIQQFTTWAMDQADIRSAIIVGSRARADKPADKMSDLDFSSHCHGSVDLSFRYDLAPQVRGTLPDFCRVDRRWKFP